jgi:hypothetical protein
MHNVNGRLVKFNDVPGRSEISDLARSSENVAVEELDLVLKANERFEGLSSGAGEVRVRHADVRRAGWRPADLGGVVFHVGVELRLGQAFDFCDRKPLPHVEGKASCSRQMNEGVRLFIDVTEALAADDKRCVRWLNAHGETSDEAFDGVTPNIHCNGLDPVPAINGGHLVVAVRLMRPARQVGVEAGVESPHVLCSKLVLGGAAGERIRSTVHQSSCRSAWEGIARSIAREPVASSSLVRRETC